MSIETTGIAGPEAVRDERSAEFFDAAARDILLIRRCDACSHFLVPEARTCSACSSGDLSWYEATGTGELVSWSVIHHPPHPAFADQVPLTVGIVELTEGPWLHARVLANHADLRASLSLTVAFLHPEQGESIPVFVARER